MPRLIVSLPDEADVTHELTEEVISVGRISDNLLQIEDASVSSHHGELTLQGEDYVLRDIGSTNGTKVNGRSIEVDEAVQLSPGDRIVFGHISTRYMTEAMSGEDLQPLPEEEASVSTPASSSVAPTNFTNAAPFEKKSVKKDPAAAAIMAFGVLAILAAAYAIFAVLQLQSPA